jgi:hypothetical protein
LSAARREIFIEKGSKRISLRVAQSFAQLGEQKHFTAAVL